MFGNDENLRHFYSQMKCSVFGTDDTSFFWAVHTVFQYFRVAWSKQYDLVCLSSSLFCMLQFSKIAQQDASYNLVSKMFYCSAHVGTP